MLTRQKKAPAIGPGRKNYSMSNRSNRSSSWAKHIKCLATLGMRCSPRSHFPHVCRCTPIAMDISVWLSPLNCLMAIALPGNGMSCIDMTRPLRPHSGQALWPDGSLFFTATRAPQFWHHSSWYFDPESECSFRPVVNCDNFLAISAPLLLVPNYVDDVINRVVYFSQIWVLNALIHRIFGSGEDIVPVVDPETGIVVFHNCGDAFFCNAVVGFGKWRGGVGFQKRRLRGDKFNTGGPVDQIDVLVFDILGPFDLIFVTFHFLLLWLGSVLLFKFIIYLSGTYVKRKMYLEC